MAAAGRRPNSFGGKDLGKTAPANTVPIKYLLKYKQKPPK